MNQYRPFLLLVVGTLVGIVASAQTNTPWATTGNIGIGTTTPDSLLSVNGVVRSTSWQPYGSLSNDFFVDVEPNTRWLRTRNFSTATPNIGATGIHTGTGYFDGWVGIGTGSPVAPLHLRSTSALGNSPMILLENTSGANAGTFGPGLVLSNNVPGSHGYIMQQRQTTASYFSISNLSPPYTDYLAIDLDGNVGIGTSAPTQKLSVNGTVRAKEVIVETTGWSDYVFADDYKLTPLSEVAEKIKADKHLPGMPSADEVAANGIGVGEMQAKLLAKVEELTLHLIAQEKMLAVQQKEIATLKFRNVALEEAVLGK